MDIPDQMPQKIEQIRGAAARSGPELELQRLHRHSQAGTNIGSNHRRNHGNP